MSPRALDIALLLVIGLAILVGGRSLMIEIAHFGGLAVSVLSTIAVVLVYAFRRNYRSGGPLVRTHAARDAASLAAIVAAIAFVLAPARWSLGASVVALEVAIVVEILVRFTEPRPLASKKDV